MSERFTAWLSDPERAALRHMAEEMHTSENYVVRSALRQYLGIGVKAAEVVKANGGE